MSNSGMDVRRPPAFIIPTNLHEGRRLLVLGSSSRRAEELADALADVSIGEYGLEHSDRAVITSSVALEYAYTSSGEVTGATAASAFTSTLVAGLAHWRDDDRDGDGLVPVNELYSF
jgi:hypothetical protein